MLAVLARSGDEAACAFAARWTAQGARLLSPQDLSTAGWRYHLESPEISTAVIGGQVVPVSEISGVWTRLHSVVPQDLGHIVAEDREYVAVEMTAFLVAWLASLTCPILNRPTPECAAGPNWRREQWVHTAALLGMPVLPMQRGTPRAGGEAKEPSRDPATVTVVGPRCFGSVDAQLMVGAQRLADAARVDLLAVHFAGPEAGSAFLSADIWPDVTQPDIAGGILEYLTGGAAW